jgi:alpha-tubulin suppressor-like RCC1 family protein
MYLFGWNYWGQLANNDITVQSRMSALQSVMSGNIWRQISQTNHFQGSAIKNDYTLWMWGENGLGELGLNDTNHRSSPCEIFGGGTWKHVCGGQSHTAALKSDGTLWCWGRNIFGNLGDLTNIHKSTPVQEIWGLNDWQTVAAGNDVTFAIRNGIVYGWGFLLLNGITYTSSPIQITATGQSYTQISAGDGSNAFLKSDGTIWMYGFNSYGQLGQNNTILGRTYSLVQVGTGTDWRSVVCSEKHTVALKTDNSLWSWGGNTDGQLGDGTVEHRSLPVQVYGDTKDWDLIAAGLDSTAAIKKDGLLWTWGQNGWYQLGNISNNNGTYRSTPAFVNAYNYKWISISAGRGTVSLLTLQEVVPTPTPSPSPSPTPSPSPSPTPSESPTPTPSESPTPTPSESPTPTPTPTATLGCVYFISSEKFTVTTKLNDPLGFNYSNDAFDNTSNPYMEFVATNTGVFSFGFYPSILFNLTAFKGRLLINGIEYTSWSSQATFTRNNWDIKAGDIVRAEIKDITESILANTISGIVTNDLCGRTPDPTASVTASPTPTPSESPTPTPSESPTPTPTESPTPTVTASPTPTPSPTPVPTCGIYENTSVRAGVDVTFNAPCSYECQSPVAFTSAQVQFTVTNNGWIKVYYYAFRTAGVIIKNGNLPSIFDFAATGNENGIFVFPVNSGENFLISLTDLSLPNDITLVVEWTLLEPIPSPTPSMSASPTPTPSASASPTPTSSSSPTPTPTPTPPSPPCVNFETSQKISVVNNFPIGYTYSNDAFTTGDTVRMEYKLTNNANFNFTYALPAPIVSGQFIVRVYVNSNLWQSFDGSQAFSGTYLRALSGEYLVLELDTITASISANTFNGVVEALECGITPLPSSSPTPSPTPTESPTPSPTPSESPTPTPTESPTPTPTPSESPTPTPSPSASGTPTPTPTESPTSTPTPTPRLFCEGFNLWLFGDNGYGQIGDGTTLHRSSPVQIGGPEWCVVDAGTEHTGAIKNDGSLWLWGRNHMGQLGDITITHRSLPIQESTGSLDWVKVSCGNGFTLGIQEDGSLWSWGRNAYGTLGNDSITRTSAPAQVIADPLIIWDKISAGFDHACAVSQSGRIYCWGNNYSGELGLNNKDDASQPIQIVSNSTDWSDVATGRDFTLGLKQDGSVWAWGKNAYGSLGLPSLVNYSSPVQVLSNTQFWFKIAAGARFGAALSLYLLPTPSPTPSSTEPTATPTCTPTPSPTPKGTEPTPSPTCSPSPTPTASPTPAGTEPTPSPTPTASPTGTPTASATVTPTPTPTPSPTNDYFQKLDIKYRIYADIGLTLPVSYDVGQGIQFVYRVETYVRNMQQPLTPFSMNYPSPAKTIMNVIATNLKDLVNKLLEIPYIWPIKTIEKFTKPIQTVDQRYLQGLGLYDPNDVRWVPVKLSDLPKSAEPLLVQYTGFERAKMSMGYFGPGSIIVGQGSVYLKGTVKANLNAQEINYKGQGNLYINGSAGVSATGVLYDTHKFGSGAVNINGEATIVTSDLGDFTENANIITVIENFDTVVLIPSVDDTPSLQRQNRTTTIATCGCDQIPTYFGLSHNLNRPSIFYKYLQRNAITLPNTIPIYYDDIKKSFTNTLQFRSSYEAEKWTISIDLNCKNDLDNFDQDYIWTLNVLFKRMSPAAVAETLVGIWIPSNSLCPVNANKFINFNISADVKQKIGIANNRTILPNVFVNDGIALFGSNSWIGNPFLNLASTSIS